MRFRKGDKVEILDKGEVSVSWRIAEILSGNGRNYQVRYNPYPAMASEQLVGTISSKLVRPCPPLHRNGGAKYQPRKVWVNNQDDEAHRVSPVISSRSLKRMSPYCTSIVEAQGCTQKLRAIQKDVGEQRLFATPVLEKVMLLLTQEIFWVKKTCILPLTLYIMDIIKWRKENKVTILTVLGLEVLNHLIPLHCQDTDTLCSDAESCYWSISKRKGYSLPPKELETFNAEFIEDNGIIWTTVGGMHHVFPKV